MTTTTVGLYVHLPWCTRKCPYCDFNSYEARRALPEVQYVDVLLADLEFELERAGGITLASIFIGGGTPSLFSGRVIGRLMDGIAARAAMTEDIEVTIEANPGSAEAGRFRDYRSAGVNRLSLGVQSFNDARLAALGRVHDGANALAAIERARQADFSNLNLDLMFGLPGARPGDALTDLRQAIDAEPTHISWYQLTVEQGTAFARNPPSLPGHDEICDDYDAGLAMLVQADYDHYEISAHARAGKMARHNLNYWHFGDYLGIGAGAHGKLTLAGSIFRRSKIRHPERYMKALLDGRDVCDEEIVVGARRASEFMLNVLRLKSGFTLDEFSAKTGIAKNDPVIALPLAEARNRGWLHDEGPNICPTAHGFRFLNDLQLLFVSDDDAEMTPVSVAET